MKQRLLFLLILASLTACSGGSSGSDDPLSKKENSGQNESDVDGDKGDGDKGDGDKGDGDKGDGDKGDDDKGDDDKGDDDKGDGDKGDGDKDTCFDFNTEGGPIEGTNVRTDGYPYRSAHILIYRFNINGAPLEWSYDQIQKDMEKARENFQEQSYCKFGLTWEFVDEINIDTSIEKFGSGTGKEVGKREWSEIQKSHIKKSGVNPDKPGGNKVVMAVATSKLREPQYGHYNSTAGSSWMNMYHHDAGTIVHELGHAMGLRHAMAVEAGNKIIGFDEDPLDHFKCRDVMLNRSARTPESEARFTECRNTFNDGYIQNYGNVYSMMGMGASGLEEFNLVYKSFFGWLDKKRDVPLVETSGTYRIYGFDHGIKSQGPIGLRLKSGNNKYTYWLEHRTHGNHAKNSTQGILINLENYAERETDPTFWRTSSNLLDMTPGSLTPGWWGDDQTDSALLINQSYTDHWGGFKITPVAKGGPENSHLSWIDIKIEILK